MSAWPRRVALVTALALITATIAWFADSAGATDLDRLGGLDRYETAALVAERVRAEGQAGDTVLLTTGENYPDAMSAGGWNGNGAILLTRRTSLPRATLDVLGQSWVRNVYVIGGPAVVDDSVLNSVRALGLTVTRLWGQDRYETAREVSRTAWVADSVSTIWVAPGTSFPDQIVAAAAARRVGGAFLVVAPSRALDVESTAEITRIATAGATLHVVDSGAILAPIAIDGLTKVDHRLDPYSTSTTTQGSGSVTIVASGENWPDALGGTRLVTADRGLLLSRQACAPTSVADRLRGSTRVTVLGGPAALSDSAARGDSCSVAPPAPPVTTPRSPLDGLRIEPEASDGYDRSLFRHWIDADRNGCDTRREVLIAESTTPVVVGTGCSITGGTWFSAYDDVTTTNASGFDIDHMVPLKEAWDSGAHSWDSTTREAFANDLSLDESLIAVSASSNRSKSDRDPADWLPPSAGYRCTYVTSWITVKKAWNLSVDQREHDALAAVLAGC